MIPNIPAVIPMPFAQNGERREIPDANTVPGSADASWSTGFPPVTRINKQAGGKPPYGLDFQGIFHALSQHLFFAQSGNVYPWQGANGTFPGLNYLTCAHVLGSDGNEYIALKPSGPDVPNTEGAGFVGPVDPVGDTTGHWTDLKTMFSVGIATLTQAGVVKPDGTTITIKPDGTISVSIGAVYELCEFYPFRNPTLRPGFQPCQGGVVQQAATLYPEAWAYLQTAEGQKLCTTEAEWQAMTRATWGDGAFKGNWDGIGGAPYFVQDLEAGTLRMPDLRGMFQRAADASLGVGEAKGDSIREIEGTAQGAYNSTGGYNSFAGAFAPTGSTIYGGVAHTLGNRGASFKASRVVPTGDVVSPRAYGVLVCAYLGNPYNAV